MSNFNDVYSVLRGRSVIVGLTGAIGSGCTETAKFLSSESFDPQILSLAFDNFNDNNVDHLERYRLKKIEEFIGYNKWESFYNLKVSDLLFCIFFSSKVFYDDDKYKLKDWFPNENQVNAANKLCLKILSLIVDEERSNSEDKLGCELKVLNEFVYNNVKKEGTEYTKSFQKIGDELRENGVSWYMDCSQGIKGSSINVFTIAQFVEKTINKLTEEGFNYIVVDALRNIYEINYLKSTFANFYLFSVVSDEKIRQKRMMGCFEFSQEDINKVQEFEKYKKLKHSQNINSCISNGDVFISNNADRESFYYSLLKYVCLIRKPGLFTPTKDERNMQIALTARYNSGCISRQVGACVTGKDGYILGVGWNDVSEGAIPCLYRSSHSLLMENSNAPEFSEYEVGNTFKSYIRNKIGANKKPFCFKDLENNRQAEESLVELQSHVELKLTDKQQNTVKNLFKNPTRERALHAEENAFLQSAKVGGASLQGGTLYTTASPCQLCAKKAMQLGVARIVYIDAYPDISTKQTLESGPQENRPKVEQFSGAAESAFMKLFKPLVNIKDELTGKDE